MEIGVRTEPQWKSEKKKKKLKLDYKNWTTKIELQNWTTKIELQKLNYKIELQKLNYKTVVKDDVMMGDFSCKDWSYIPTNYSKKYSTTVEMKLQYN